MSLRSLFVINLNDTKIIFHKIFPSVEKRWARDHEPFYKPLPTEQKLLHLLLTELGLIQTNSFEAARDSCCKELRAPLFWVLHDSKSASVWPVVVTEYRNRVFCAVPFIKQSCESEQPSTLTSPDVAVAFEILCKLLPIASFPLNEFEDLLTKVIQQWLPFGRPMGLCGLELLGRPSSGQKGLWIRSKPQLEVQVKEEIKAVILGKSNSAELCGSIILSMEQDAEIGEVKLQITFPKLVKLPALVTHPSSKLAVEGDSFNFLIRSTQEKTIPMCHYNLQLEAAPIEAVFKTKSDNPKSSIFIQLHPKISTRLTLTQLEVHVIMPTLVRVSRILTPAAQISGTVSLQKSGSMLVWNLLSPGTSSKIKDDVALNLDVETIEPGASLVESYALVIFSANATLSGAQLNFLQPSKFKPIISQELKNSVYRVWNQESLDVL